MLDYLLSCHISSLDKIVFHVEEYEDVKEGKEEENKWGSKDGEESLGITSCDEKEEPEENSWVGDILDDISWYHEGQGTNADAEGNHMDKDEQVFKILHMSTQFDQANQGIDCNKHVESIDKGSFSSIDGYDLDASKGGYYLKEGEFDKFPLNIVLFISGDFREDHISKAEKETISWERVEGDNQAGNQESLLERFVNIVTKWGWFVDDILFANRFAFNEILGSCIIAEMSQKLLQSGFIFLLDHLFDCWIAE